MKHRLALILPAYFLAYVSCYYVSFLLRFDFDIPQLYAERFTLSLPLILAAKFAMCLAYGEWRRSFRYATFTDGVFLVASATSAAAVLFLLNTSNLIGHILPRSVIMIDWMLSILTVGVMRCGVRLYREALRTLFARQNIRRTFIYGVDSASIAILRTMQGSSDEYRVVGFVDENPAIQQSTISGIRVYSQAVGWRRLKRRLNAEHVLIPSTVPGQTVRAILKDCSRNGLKTHIIPGVQDLVDGKYKLAIRDVTISDLLRRPPAQLDAEAIREYVANRRVLVTGGAGSIGSEVCRQLLTHGPASLILVDQSEFGVFSMEQEFKHLDTDVSLHYTIASVGDERAMTRVMEEHQPQLVFHAAAYKHVPLMEDNPHEAIRNNILGTRMMVNLADRYHVERFVLISTDKAVRPSSVMGCSKLVAEKYLQAVSNRSQTQYITVRFGNVLNSAGSVVPTFRRQIEKGGPITVTHPEMVRFFMTIPEAVQLVHQAGAIGQSGDVLILEMGDPVRIYDLAKDMILLSGLRYPDDIDIEFSGMRPGEKLYEELFYETEAGAKQVHEKIYRATRRWVHLTEVNRDIARLEATLDGDRAEAARVLWDIVGQHVALDSVPEPRLRSAA